MTNLARHSIVALALFLNIQPIPASGLNGTIETAEQFLARLHFAPTDDGLTRALDDPNTETRTQAAVAIGHSGHQDLLPVLRRALQKEPLPSIQVTIASALADIQPSEGIPILRSMCADRTRIAGLRVQAAQLLVWMHHDECLPNVLDVLRAPDNDGPDPTGLDMLVQFDHVSEANRLEIRNIATSYLSDRQPFIRMSASRVLAMFGDAASAENLKAAILREEVEFVRSSMQESVKSLSNNTHD